LHLAQLLEPPVGAGIGDHCVDAVTVAQGAVHQLAGEGADVGRSRRVVGLVEKRVPRVAAGPLQLEQDTKRELPAAMPATGGAGHPKTTSLTLTFTSAMPRPSIRSMASATRRCTSAPIAGSSVPAVMTT